MNLLNYALFETLQTLTNNKLSLIPCSLSKCVYVCDFFMSIFMILRYKSLSVRYILCMKHEKWSAAMHRDIMTHVKRIVLPKMKIMHLFTLRSFQRHLFIFRKKKSIHPSIHLYFLYFLLIFVYPSKVNTTKIQKRNRHCKSNPVTLYFKVQFSLLTNH